MIDYGTTFFTNSGYSFQVDLAPDALDIVVSDRDGRRVSLVGLYSEDLDGLTEALIATLVAVRGEE